MQGMSPESELLSKMHMANQMEIKAGQLAESKGTTEQFEISEHCWRGTIATLTNGSPILRSSKESS